MSRARLTKLAGILFLIGAVVINVPYTLLIARFDYPDILREPTGYILTHYMAGGTDLLMTWFAFAWAGLPLLFGAILLHRLLAEEAPASIAVATTFGVLGMVAQVVGLLRWVFVVPLLARAYTDPAASEATRAAVEVGFQAIHQYGGVILGSTSANSSPSPGWSSSVPSCCARAGSAPGSAGSVSGRQPSTGSPNWNC